MAELFTELIHNIIDAITQVLKDEEYLIKGGQALLYHMKNASAINDVRFSKDLDISFSSACFPIDAELFKNKFVENYNKVSANFIIDKNDLILQKLPNKENLYFGLRLILNVRKKKSNGAIGKKVYFKDLDGLAIIIDLNCGEFVDSNFIVFVDNKIKIAAIPLIIAEKYRALCTQFDDIFPSYKPTPRPKDFFDIFLIFNRFYKKKLTIHNIEEIKIALKNCFEKKSMNTNLLKRLYEEKVKAFHDTMFIEQVIDTLPASSTYKDLTFDQVYSESLEFLDILL